MLGDSQNYGRLATTTSRSSGEETKSTIGFRELISDESCHGGRSRHIFTGTHVRCHSAHIFLDQGAPLLPLSGAPRSHKSAPR